MSQAAVQQVAREATYQYQTGVQQAGQSGAFAAALAAAEAAGGTAQVTTTANYSGVNDTTVAGASAAAAGTTSAASAQGATGTYSSGLDALGLSSADLATLFITQFATGGGSSGQLFLMLALALLQGSSSGSLFGSSSGSSLLSAGISALTGSAAYGSGLYGTGSLLGGSAESSDSWLSSGLYGSSSAASQAATVSAQAMLNAYNNTASARTDNTSWFQSVMNSVAGSGMATAQEAADLGVGSGNSPGSEVRPVVTSDVGNRSAALYRKVIDQFNVESNPRYAVRTNEDGTTSTYCNIFMWDVTCAMGAEIPHYTVAATGEPAEGHGEGIISMNANRISNWLNQHGTKYGWYEVTAEQAQQLANRGCPAVTVWKNNSGGHGHVQVVSPSEDGMFDASRGVAVAQAGRNLRNYTYITNLYSSRLKDVQYFAHI